MLWLSLNRFNWLNFWWRCHFPNHWKTTPNCQVCKFSVAIAILFPCQHCLCKVLLKELLFILRAHTYAELSVHFLASTFLFVVFSSLGWVGILYWRWTNVLNRDYSLPSYTDDFQLPDPTAIEIPNIPNHTKHILEQHPL